MSDYITDRDGKRITAKQVEDAISALNIIGTWAAFQLERQAEPPDDVLRQIAMMVDNTLERMK